jgi:Ca2+-binding EF-hand superfamily protein
MRRFFLASTVVLALALGGLVAAHNQNKTDQKNPQETKKQPGNPFRIDVDRLIKEYDKNGDGFLQRDEVPGYLREHFDKLDTNKDGKLSREELEQGAALLQPKRRPSDVVFVLIEMSDCDECCAEELQRIYDVLRKLDKGNTGKIDPAALKTIRQELVEERVDAIIKELDTNKDGKISRDEARGMLKQNFDMIDTNKDGFIDRAELLRAASERIIAKQKKEK